MDTKKLCNLLKKNEGVKLDFKVKVDLSTESSRKELAKDICAIANSKGGRGYLIIGIEDKTKKIIGIKDDELVEEQIQQIVSSRCEPPIPITFEIVNYKEEELGIITIYDGPQKPYQMRENGSFYIRRGSTTDTMRKQELVEALTENLMLNPELCPIVKSSVECLNMDLINNYFEYKGIGILNYEETIKRMQEASIITQDKDSGKNMVTLGGLLVFCKKNYVYIPHNMIRIINRINNNFDEEILVQGDLLHIIDECEKILGCILPEDYPAYLIGEGVKNAVLYRNYSLFDRIIEITLGDSNVTIKSPGAFIESREVNNSGYIKRNMWIYEKLTSLDNKGRFGKNGEGFIRMKSGFKNKGGVRFFNSLYNDNFKVIYPGVNKFK